jgi:hypothetical protein
VKTLHPIDLSARLSEKHSEESPGKDGAREKKRRRIKEEIRKEV